MTQLKTIITLLLVLMLAFALTQCTEHILNPNNDWTAGDEWFDVRDGQSYNTVQIGDQIWMAENLRATKFNDGTDIPLVTKGKTWDGLRSRAYCWYDNVETTYKNTYGALYTWPAAMNGAASSSSNPSDVQGVCPVGWHLPSKTEWDELINYLGGSSVAGGKLKEAGLNVKRGFIL